MWKTVKLGEICNFEGGSQPPKKEFVYEPAKGYLRFLQIRDFKTDKNITYIPIAKKNRLCAEDDILIGRYGASVGKILNGLSGAYNVALMKTIPNEELISKGWLYAYLTSTLFQHPLVEVSSRSAQNGFSKDDINGFDVPLPPLAEQQRIVAKLDAAFSEIDTAIAAAEKSAENANDMFTTYLSNVFKAEKDGWFEGSIEDVCTIKSGTSVKVELEKSDGDIPYLKVADMNLKENADEVVTSSRFLNADDIGKNRIIEVGSTIFPKRGGAIMTNKKRIISVPICADLNIMSVCPNRTLRPKLLFYYFLNVDMKQLGSGSSIPQINNYDIQPLPISFPQSIAEQDELISKFDELLKYTTHLCEIFQKKKTEFGALQSSLLAAELTQQSEAA
jgi:type I restriction enzyme, S subunit